MSKLGAVGRGIGWLISFITRTSYHFFHYLALGLSIGFAVYTVGEYTRAAMKDKKSVLDLVYWRDPKKSGAALALTLAVVFLFAKVPFLSLVVYSALAVLAGTLGFRVFKLVEAQVKKTDASNPFHPYLERDIVVPQERVHAQVDVLVEHAQSVLIQLRRLFLVENLLDSIKFGLLLWTLTYIAAWFSGLALVVIFVLGVFAVPKFYEVNKQPIDQYLAIAHENVEKVNNTLQDKLPFLKKAPARVAQEAKKEE
jgi:hypothetical protein